VPEDLQPPVAIRITRPYATEEEFLEQELDTLSRTSVTLLGAQPRPLGVVLRFELVLSSGNVLMRGEGRVVGFRPNAHQGLGGLTLRFTRLDSRSKALVDRAAAVRERRRPSATPTAGAPSTPLAAQPSQPEVLALPSEPEVLGRQSEPEGPSSVPSRVHPAPERPLGLEAASVDPPSAERSEPRLLSERPLLPRTGVADAPSGRDEVLARLRARGEGLDAGAVQRILEQRKRQA
jgi:molecular chaperone DnaK